MPFGAYEQLLCSSTSCTTRITSSGPPPSHPAAGRVHGVDDRGGSRPACVSTDDRGTVATAWRETNGTARNAFSNEEEDDRGDSVDISQPETENDNENHDLPEANENAINQGATEDIIHSQQQQTTTTTEVTESEEVQFQLIAKTTTTGKKSHIFKVGNYKYLGRGIKENGLSFFY